MHKEPISVVNKIIKSKKDLKSELKATDLRIKQAKAEEMESKLSKRKV